MRNVIPMICAIILFATSSAQAFDALNKHVPEAQKVGEGRFTKYIWDVYDAVLYAPQGSWKKDQPFALKLSYLRQLSGKKIADRSIEEIRGQGFTDEIKLAAWHTQMRRIFPDVYKGITLTGVYTQKGNAVFYKDGSEIGRIEDPEFSKAFFGIWLNKETSAPDLRQKLLGQYE